MNLDALWPEDRPRQKLIQRGAKTLGVNELLAVLLGSGTRNASALELSNQLLRQAGGLDGLLRQSPAGLARVPGLKDARVARILAALELGRRAASAPEPARLRFRVPEDAGRYLMPRFGTKPLEEFGMLALDSRNGLMRLEIVSNGSLNGSLAHPREVYREAAILRAAAIVVFHNHPSRAIQHHRARTGSSPTGCTGRGRSWASAFWTTSSSAPAATGVSKSHHEL